MKKKVLLTIGLVLLIGLGIYFFIDVLQTIIMHTDTNGASSVDWVIYYDALTKIVIKFVLLSIFIFSSIAFCGYKIFDIWRNRD